LIKDFMELSDNQVLLYNQNFDLPKSGMIIVVTYNNSTPIGTIKEAFDDGSGLSEKHTVTQVENYTISILSSLEDEESTNRKEEILMALKSYKAEEVQRQEHFSIAPIYSNFIRVPTEESGTQRLRFDIDINLNTWYTKAVSIPYYDHNFGIQTEESGDIAHDEVIYNK